MENTLREKTKELMILLIIVMIGTLIRLPIGNFAEIDVTRLNDPDSYFYARKAIELYNTPFSEWSLSVSRADDPLMNSVYPETDNNLPILLSVLVAFACRVFKFLPIDSVIYYFVTVLCPLSAIPAFFFVKHHSNRIGGYVAALAMAIAPSYFSHTVYGYFDTDAIIMVAATSFVLCFFETVFETETVKKIVFAVFSFFWLLILSFAWVAFYYYVAMVTVIAAIVFLLSKEKRKFNVTIISSFLFVAYCFVKSFTSIKKSFIGLITSTETADTWPLPSKFINELTVPKLLSDGPNYGFSVSKIGVINWIGGLPVFFAFCLLLFGVLYAYFRKSKAEKVSFDFNFEIILTLLIWVVITLIVVSRGIRYVQLLALPINVFLGYGSGVILKSAKEIKLPTIPNDLFVLLVSVLLFGAVKNINFYFAVVTAFAFLLLALLRKPDFSSVVVMLLIVVFLCPVAHEYRWAKNATPFISGDTEEGAEYLYNNSPDDAVIISWWGQGYYYQYSTGRTVVADGGTYNGAYYYWLANIFTTDNPELSRGICRMLSGGSLEAVDLIQKETASCKATADLLNIILVKDRGDAKDYLISELGFSENDAEEIVKYSHPNVTRPIYLVFSDEMMASLEAIGYFGLWDFEDEYIPEVSFDYEIERVIYPDVISESLIVKMYENEPISGFKEVYSNDTASVYRIE